MATYNTLPARARRLTAPVGTYLTDEQIRQVAPSVYASTAHASRSAGFAPIPTSEILIGLRREGFDVVQAGQSRCRDESRTGFNKHLLRLRHRDQKPGKAQAIGDVFPEVVLVNANDGSSSYAMSAGLFRLGCLNGMTVSEREFTAVRKRRWNTRSPGRRLPCRRPSKSPSPSPPASSGSAMPRATSRPRSRPRNSSR